MIGESLHCRLGPGTEESAGVCVMGLLEHQGEALEDAYETRNQITK
jgi:hypothetical protein